MNVVRRLTRALGLSVLLAVFVWTGSTASSQAAGYWTCTGGAWSAVGNPQHATPLKSCGSHLEIPRTQRACENAGGRWGRAGLFPKPICTMPTHDGGRPCADIDECEGSCLADLTPPQRDLLMQREKLEILGKCTPLFARVRLHGSRQRGIRFRPIVQGLTIDRPAIGSRAGGRRRGQRWCRGLAQASRRPPRKKGHSLPQASGSLRKTVLLQLGTHARVGSRAVHLPGGSFTALKPRTAHPAANPKINKAIGGPKSRTGITRKSPVVLNPP
jgi:hypothetical protein